MKKFLFLIMLFSMTTGLFAKSNSLDIFGAVKSNNLKQVKRLVK